MDYSSKLTATTGHCLPVTSLYGTLNENLFIIETTNLHEPIARQPINKQVRKTSSDKLQLLFRLDRIMHLKAEFVRISDLEVSYTQDYHLFRVHYLQTCFNVHLPYCLAIGKKSESIISL